ncbi:hypothetical protein HOP50_09g55990 [Chloropicon primus]|uniref:Uncharacterized protein n=1 Tax=Chloropicon primus TaxID=1764295 RepID=A0A5B8MR67_9CHLO|nr:hypothetical protein A3770_09p55770 [Chloropicon primus]UPR02273.1 hypothetical protein HOP50_09g55990 [Chloropicon primus]|eukprot:QDZ23059.1 hypothetical protein A3770_09p55770 [Chloropicon primus]
MGGFEGDWVEPKTNAVIEDANWRQRITSEIDAADSWTNEWGFLVEKDGETLTQMAKREAAHAEPSKGERSKRRDEDSTFMTHFKRTTKGFAKPYPQDVFKRPVLTSHQYGWNPNTLEIFGRLNMNMR